MDEKQHDAHDATNKPYDAEIDFRAIAISGAGLVAITLVALLAMWWLSAAFKSQEIAKDPTPSPLMEARQDPIPPGPRLQASPPHDMNEMRAADRKALTTYGWVDEANGIARIPVDRAISILAEKGLAPTPDNKKESK